MNLLLKDTPISDSDLFHIKNKAEHDIALCILSIFSDLKTLTERQLNFIIISDYNYFLMIKERDTSSYYLNVYTLYEITDKRFVKNFKPFSALLEL